MPGTPFTIADQANLEPGYYWIRRNEPDGPPEWEVARFSRWKGLERWYVCGSSYEKSPTRDPNASNAWRIGRKVSPPD